jgi:hypothetical protein
VHPEGKRREKLRHDVSSDNLKRCFETLAGHRKLIPLSFASNADETRLRLPKKTSPLEVMLSIVAMICILPPSHFEGNIIPEIESMDSRNEVHKAERWPWIDQIVQLPLSDSQEQSDQYLIEWKPIT